MSETQISFNNKKAEFEQLRSDVQIKLKFLDENRVSGSTDFFIFRVKPILGKGDG